VTTDRAPAYPRVIDELVLEACHVVEQYANDPIEADHGRLKAEHDDARPETATLRPGGLQWACIRPELAPWTLRTRT
jgi:hypothetical protein